MEQLLNNIAVASPNLLGGAPGRPGTPHPVTTRAKHLVGRLKKLRTGGGRGGSRGDNGGGNLGGRSLLADGQAEQDARDTALFLSSPQAQLVMQVRQRCLRWGA